MHVLYQDINVKDLSDFVHHKARDCTNHFQFSTLHKSVNNSQRVEAEKQRLSQFNEKALTTLLEVSVLPSVVKNSTSIDARSSESSATPNRLENVITIKMIKR